LTNKIRAYDLQDSGLDTVDANKALGFEADERDYDIAGRMLGMLGCTHIQLLTNNPAKVYGLSRTGIEVVAVLPLVAPISPDNRGYLATMAARLGHRIDALPLPRRRDG
jgi:GTP cyclohydrolase II